MLPFIMRQYELNLIPAVPTPSLRIGLFFTLFGVPVSPQPCSQPWSNHWPAVACTATCPLAPTARKSYYKQHLQFGGAKWMAIYNSSNSIPQPSLGHGCYTPCSPTTAILRLKLESIVEQSPHNIPVIHHIHLIPLYPQIPAIDSALAFSLQSPTALYFFLLANFKSLTTHI